MRTRYIENYALTTGAYAFDNPVRRFNEIFEEFVKRYAIIPIERLNEIHFVRDATKNNK